MCSHVFICSINFLSKVCHNFVNIANTTKLKSLIGIFGFLMGTIASAIGNMYLVVSSHVFIFSINFLSSVCHNSINIANITKFKSLNGIFDFLVECIAYAIGNTYPVMCPMFLFVLLIP